jgi:hypothetical protein
VRARRSCAHFVDREEVRYPDPVRSSLFGLPLLIGLGGCEVTAAAPAAMQEPPVVRAVPEHRILQSVPSPVPPGAHDPDLPLPRPEIPPEVLADPNLRWAPAENYTIREGGIGNVLMNIPCTPMGRDQPTVWVMAPRRVGKKKSAHQVAVETCARIVAGVVTQAPP